MSSIIPEPARDAFDAGGRGMQHHGLRRANERAVLTVIGFNPGVSNADIARISGLAPQTVSAILVELDRAGLIERGEVLRGRRGQPATPIFLRAEGGLAIGVEIGWRHLDVLLLNLHGQVVAHRHKTYRFPDAASIFDDIVAIKDQLLATVPEDRRQRLFDIGIAMPTNIAANLNLVAAPAEQEALWRDMDVAAELHRRTRLDVTVFNDGNAACWAQLIAFAKPRPANFIYFLISRYIAAGIVGEGMLWEGPNGNSANLGSMLVHTEEGSLRPAHFIASLAALEARLREAGLPVDYAELASWDWATFGPVLDRWLDDSAKALARVVFNTTTVIECGLVVLDGLLPSSIVSQLVLRLEAELRQLPVSSYAPPQVLPGHLGALAPAVGASELTLYRRYFSRSLANLAG